MQVSRRLISDGLYARIAVAFHSGQHRVVSLCLLARELGAVRYRVKGAFRSRGGAAADAAKIWATGPASLNSSLATSCAMPPADLEHMARNASSLSSPSKRSPGHGGPALPEEDSGAGVEAAEPSTPAGCYAAQKLQANTDESVGANTENQSAPICRI